MTKLSSMHSAAIGFVAGLGVLALRFEFPQS